jgi:hypothetical protein
MPSLSVLGGQNRHKHEQQTYTAQRWLPLLWWRLASNELNSCCLLLPWELVTYPNRSTSSLVFVTVKHFSGLCRTLCASPYISNIISFFKTASRGRCCFIARCEGPRNRCPPCDSHPSSSAQIHSHHKHRLYDVRINKARLSAIFIYFSYWYCLVLAAGIARCFCLAAAFAVKMCGGLLNILGVCSRYCVKFLVKCRRPIGTLVCTC